MGRVIAGNRRLRRRCGAMYRSSHCPARAIYTDESSVDSRSADLPHAGPKSPKQLVFVRWSLQRRALHSFLVFSRDFALAFVRKRCEWCYRVRLSPLYSLGVFLSLVFIDFIFEILFFFLSFLLSFSCTNILILIFEKNVLLRSHA